MIEETEAVVVRAQRGDIDAFETLVKRFQNMAYGYAFSLLSDFHLAQDATQEAFIDAYRRLSQLRNPAAFAGWFRRVVFKHCDRIRRQKHARTVPVDDVALVASDEPGPDELVVRKEIKAEVLQAVAGLPEHERSATTLYYIDGCSQREIGEFLGVSENTIKSRLHSARKRLKERMMSMVEKTMKGAPLPDDFASSVVRKVGSGKDLEGAKKLLAGSYQGKREPASFLSVEAAGEADIYVVTRNGEVESAGFYDEMEFGIGETPLTVARPREMAREAMGVPDPAFAKGMAGCFKMAGERGRSLAVLHGSMFDHGFCGLVPSFYYCVASLPVEKVPDSGTNVRCRPADDDAERVEGTKAHLKDPYSAKISAFLGGGELHVLEGRGTVEGYFRSNPEVFEKARRAGMEQAFGYVNSITVKSREAAVALLQHAARLAGEAGQGEVLILESHETLVAQTVLSLGGSYILRASCPLQGLDAEMVAILDLQGLSRALEDEFQRRVERSRATTKAQPAALSIEMNRETVGFVMDSGRLTVTAQRQKIHLVLPRWLATRLFLGYHSGSDALSMGPIPWDRSDGRNPDSRELDMKPLMLPAPEATLFAALFPKLWPCSLPDPDVWPWVIGEPHPTYQHEQAKTPEMKAAIDLLRFPWIGY